MCKMDEQSATAKQIPRSFDCQKCVVYSCFFLVFLIVQT